MSNYQHWLITEDNHIATLTLNRPEVMNRLAAQTLFELRDITAHLRTRKDIWGVIIQGQGDNFSVGIDVNLLKDMIAQDQSEYRATWRDLQGCFEEFEALEKPTIARLHGYCLGAGLMLALCCDFRVASQATTFGFPAVKLSVGVIVGTQRITRIAGVAATKEILYLGKNFDAQAAKNYGLLHNVVSGEELDATVTQLVDRIRQLPPRAIGISKRIIDRGYAMSLRGSQTLELDAQAELLHSPDFQEAIAGFFEKRSPQFTGE